MYKSVSAQLWEQDLLFNASDLNNPAAAMRSLMKHKTFSSKGWLQNNNRGNVVHYLGELHFAFLDMLLLTSRIVWHLVEHVPIELKVGWEWRRDGKSGAK